MRKVFACFIVVALTGTAGFGRAARQTPAGQPPAGQATAAKPTVDDVLKEFRADLQGTRADIIAKNISLNATQAAKFWPMFEQYQKDQNVIMDAQLKDIQKYVETAETLDDAGALALINAHFGRDERMTTLRKQWLAEFQTVLPMKLAVRVMQIDRRLSLVSQLEIASRIPLVH
jgi:Spy/CpxP family protein refolding chaperone